MREGQQIIRYMHEYVQEAEKEFDNELVFLWKKKSDFKNIKVKIIIMKIEDGIFNNKKQNIFKRIINKIIKRKNKEEIL